jgi:alkyl hydroperoxide reductase subunit AhpF
LLPNSALARQLARTNVDGFIMVDDKNATPQLGLFAAVDVTTACAEQVLIAIGEGARRGQRVRVFFFEYFARAGGSAPTSPLTKYGGKPWVPHADG